MHTENEIVIRATPAKIFALVSDLAKWPDLLPHYRSVQVLSREPDASVVRMAALRSGIPIAWVSRYRADPADHTLHFEHLRAFTKGMIVVWTMEPRKDGSTLVRIRHDLAFKPRLLAPLAEAIIGGFFIRHVASLTLATFKRIAEHE